MHVGVYSYESGIFFYKIRNNHHINIFPNSLHLFIFFFGNSKKLIYIIIK